MEDKPKYKIQLGTIGFYYDEKTDPIVLVENFKTCLRQKINKAKYYLNLLEQELKDIENLNFDVNKF